MKRAMAILILAFMVVPFQVATTQETEELDKDLRGWVVLGQEDDVRKLIKAGADVNKRFDFGASRNITSLYLAVMGGHADIGKVLIDSGADVNIEFEGLNLLHVAALYAGNKAVTELLITNGLDVEAKCTLSGETKDATPLSTAAAKGNIEVAETLIKNGADVGAKLFSNDYTPLHVAARRGHKEVTELLIANGADVNAKTKYGETPLDLAISKEHIELALLLSKHGGIFGKK